MKFVGLDGREYGKDMSRYIWTGRKGTSLGETKLGERVRALFPNSTIYTQFPCLGTDLRLDYYIHTIKTAFEFDGKQHKEFSPYFHKNKRGWHRALDNDRKKAEWCEANGIKLIRIDDKNFDLLEEKICE